MDIELPDDFVEIQDPEIDPQEIMERIREGIQQRRETLGYPRQTFPLFDAAAYPGEPEGEVFDKDLYYHLRRANDLYYQIDVEASLSPSPATRLPVLGRLWRRVRKEAHNLVLFYVGKLVRRQVPVNRHLVSTLNRLVLQVQAQQQALQALQAEVAELREQLDVRSD